MAHMNLKSNHRNQSIQQQQSSPPSPPPQQIFSRQFEMHLRQQLQMEQQQIMQQLQLSSHRQYLLSKLFFIYFHCLKNLK
ncbi:hypothetical protein BLA29_001964 [Euroglyphus maynei]|uniref:Uncharacterized protein n=1 Tax=Euroglyphus maynei TaxID=6958 RepID=A0A1Y3B3V2_EURMA|nr:hypothetical protein BLA29_001964 [Euroglyphus maynei]